LAAAGQQPAGIIRAEPPPATGGAQQHLAAREGAPLPQQAPIESAGTSSAAIKSAADTRTVYETVLIPR
jgi:hypothetical protein